MTKRTMFATAAAVFAVGTFATAAYRPGPVHRRQRLQGPERVQVRSQRLQGPERLQGQGLRQRGQHHRMHRAQDEVTV